MLRWVVDDEVELRLLEERHTELVYETVRENRAYLAEWLSWAREEPAPEKTRAFIRSALERFAHRNGMTLGIWYQGTFVGIISYVYIRWRDRRTEIGYWLAKAYQGRGIITRAVRALCQYAFEELGLNRVEIRCATGNIRSCAIAERVGFTREGVMRQYAAREGGFDDMALYGLLAEEWGRTQ